MIPVALVALLASSAPSPPFLVQADPELTARLERSRSAHGIPGMGAVVLRGNRIMIAVTGKRRADRDARLVATDAFHLGSDTKGMTASLVARLVERGLLRWDETLAEALPEIAPKMDPGFKSVTLDMLMRHVAGLPTGGAFTPEFTEGFDDEHWPIAKQRMWMAERFLSRPPKEMPGTRFAYSNYGYLILGHVVEHAAGKTWEELLRDEVFAPLAMTGCGFGPTATSAHPEGNWGHDVKNNAYVPTEEDNPQLIGPAGTVHCPLVDWARFAAAHAGFPPPRWLTEASLAHLHEPKGFAGVQPGKDIALGWGVTRTQPPRLTHSGSNGYNQAEIVVIPSLHTAVLVTSNAGDEPARAAAKEVLDALVEGIAGQARGEDGARRRDPHDDGSRPQGLTSSVIDASIGRSPAQNLASCLPNGSRRCPRLHHHVWLPDDEGESPLAPDPRVRAASARSSVRNGYRLADYSTVRCTHEPLNLMASAILSDANDDEKRLVLRSLGLS
jgi:CubicO group peptidase (beta-lactamase class C family)